MQRGKNVAQSERELKRKNQQIEEEKTRKLQTQINMK